jgi:nitrogen fixation/metabolism regulation signal transduction histidine kinase
MSAEVTSGRRLGISRFVVPHASFIWLTKSVWLLALGTGIFLGAIAWSYDYYLFQALDISEIALDSPGIQRYLRFTILNSAVLALAYAVYMTIMAAFLFYRVSGPIYRIKAHMEAVAAGETTSECSVREGDQLQDVCDAYNQLLHSLDLLESKPLDDSNA